MAFRAKIAVPVIMLILLVKLDAVYAADVQTTVTNYDKYTQLNLNEEHSLELLQHWTDQAFSGLLGALATVRLDEVHEDDQEEHAQCAKNASSVIEHAKCTVELMDKKKVIKSPKNSTKTRKQKKQKSIRITPSREFKKPRKWNNKKKYRKMRKGKKTPSGVEWTGSFRRAKRSLDLGAFVANIPKEKKMKGTHKRRTEKKTILKISPMKVRRTSSYSLKEARSDKPLDDLAKAIKKGVLQAKHKNAEQSKDWVTVIKEIKEETMKLKARNAMRKMFKKKFDMIIEGHGNSTMMAEQKSLVKDLEDLDEMSHEELIEKAHQMEDSLTGDQKMLREPLKLMREAVKLGLMATGTNVSDFADKTLKLISPRLLPLTAEEENAQDDEVSLLSPSLFALHNEGKGVEKATSLVDGMGLAKAKEHMAWLDMIMEAAGVTDAVQYLKDEKIKKTMTSDLGGADMRTPNGQPRYFTKQNVSEIFGDHETKKIDTFEQLHGIFTPEQVEEQKKQGFAILTKEQLEIVYGKNSPYADEERLKTLKGIPKGEMLGHVERNIRALAEMKSFEVGKHAPGRARRKRALLLAVVILIPLIFASKILSGPIILTPIILSPVILSPAILGPLILSPTVFVPIILSPRALSPFILSPLVFDPVILSPLVLHPFILSPGVFNPFVLSPFALSPFILSPQVFTPIILSPFVLSPIILTPTVGTPLIVSPFALSPIISSAQIMFAAVLSPYVLSPIIDSPLIFAEVIASPSALS